jgi:hypothetical protein
MFANKKNAFIITLCLLITLFSFPHLWAQGELKLEKQKEGSKQKHVPALIIEGAKIQVVPVKKAPEKQKSKSTQEDFSAEDQPQISLDSTHYDAGEVYEGDKVVHTFIAKNKGTSQLNIKKVAPG